VSGFVFTVSFQAPEFYRRHGWVEFGRVPSRGGISRVFFQKDLTP
jgi:hypothetical protein